MPTCYGGEGAWHPGVEMVAGEESDEERPLAGGEKTVDPGGCSCPRCRQVEIIRTYCCPSCGATEKKDVTPDGN